MKDIIEVPDEDVRVKQSFCPKCHGMVTAAVLHKMSLKDRREFAKDVFNYNLLVQEISLELYRKTITSQKWCLCEKL